MPKRAAKRACCCGVIGWSAEEQDLVLDQQLLQTLDVRRREIPGQVEPAHLGTQSPADTCDLNGHKLPLFPPFAGPGRLYERQPRA